MFEAEIEQAKQSAGNTLFDALTGAIKGQLTNSGVAIKNTAVPVSGSTNTAGIQMPAISTNMIYIGAGLIGAFILFKKYGKRRV